MYEDDNPENELNIVFNQREQYHYQKQKYQLYGYLDVVGLKAFENIKKRAYKTVSILELFMVNIQKQAQLLEEKYKFPYEIVDSITEKNLDVNYTLILNPLAFLLGWYMARYRYDKVYIENIIKEEGDKIDMFAVIRYKMYIQNKIFKEELKSDSSFNFNEYLISFNLKNRPKQKYQKIKETLHDILPEIFPRGYARFCLKSPIKTEDEKDFEFTRNSGNYFSCKNHKDFEHIGLKNNNLSNREKYPLLPCCYQKSQDKPNSKKYLYEHEDLDTIQTDKSKIDYTKLVSSKSIYSIEGNIRYALLPSNLKLLFSIIDTNKYIRMSITKDPKSSLLCLLNCFKMNEKNAIEKIKNLIINEYGNVDKNEMLDIIHNNKFMDGKKFLPLYEEVFNCNIIMFCLNIKINPNGTICTQYYKYKILKKNNNLPYIFLFESYGSEMDNYSYPQYELIVSSEIKDNKVILSSVNKVFSKDDKVVQSLINIYIDQFPIKYEKLTFKTPIINQIKDSNNLVRIIKFDKVNCLIDPINTFNINIETLETKLVLNDTKDVLEFIEKEKLIDNFKYVLNNTIYGIVSIKKINNRNIRMFFPTYNNDINFPLYDLDKENAICPVDLKNNNSLLNIYRNYTKINRCMVSLLSYLYSLFKNKFIDISFDEFYNECKELLIVTDNFENTVLERNLNLMNPYYFENKLKIPSEKYGIKLVYALYLKLKNNYKEIIEFKNNTFIPDYYKDINDFTPSNNFTILNNISLILFNNYETNDYNLYSTINTEKTVFYMKNPLIEKNEIILVRKVNEPEDKNFKFYTYESEDNIKVYNRELDNPYIIVNIDDNIIFFKIKKILNNLI